MPNAVPIPVTIFDHTTFTLFARVWDDTGELIAQAAVSEIRYTVRRLNKYNQAEPADVLGHTNVAIAVATSVFDTLQGAGGSDPRWTEDTEGYNFRYQIPITIAHAFEEVGTYQVNVVFNPITGQPYTVRFNVTVI